MRESERLRKHLVRRLRPKFRIKDEKKQALRARQLRSAAVKSVKTGFRSAVRIAGLSTQSGKVTPHTLRHTAATWLMQRGADPWKAAGFLGMSVEVLLDTYGHHHPEFLRDAAAAITSKPKQNIVSGVISGVDFAAYREKRRKS